MKFSFFTNLFLSRKQEKKHVYESGARSFRICSSFLHLKYSTKFVFEKKEQKLNMKYPLINSSLFNL